MRTIIFSLGKSIQVIVQRNLVTNVTRIATTNCDRIAVVDSNSSYSYGQIYKQAQLIASHLDTIPGLIHTCYKINQNFAVSSFVQGTPVFKVENQ